MDRALILIEQSNFGLAEIELRGFLAKYPDDARAHALLGVCLCRLSRLSEAMEEAKTAVKLSPDLPFAHYVLADIWHMVGRLGKAEAAIREALRLAPDTADFHARLSSIPFDQRRWTEALYAAESGLILAPDDILCMNLRAMALISLDRASEAREMIENALATDPSNAVTHANAGWERLHSGDYEDALWHLREALRLAPQLEWAKKGLVEVLKARHFIYRPTLGVLLWFSKAGRITRWSVPLACMLALFAFSIVSSFDLILTAVGLILLAAGYVLVLSGALLNLFLRFDALGRFAVSREQMKVSLLLALFLVLAVAPFTAGLIIGSPVIFLGGLVCGFSVLPLIGVLYARSRWHRSVSIGCLAVTTTSGIWLLALLLAPSGTRDNSTMGIAFSLVLVGGLLGALLPYHRRWPGTD